MKVTCDKCDGTGSIDVVDTSCQAVFVVGHETVACYGEDRHPGEPHMAIACTPCADCGGYDEHHATCATYEALPWVDADQWWYAWRDRDLALSRVSDEVGRAWRQRHQPSSPWTKRSAA